MGLFDRWTGRRRQRGGGRPLIQISETNEVATGPGQGVRSCAECGTMWKSFLGELRDSGELDRKREMGEIRIYASWEETLGLTCAGCRRSLCVAHMGQPRTTEAVPQASDYVCPYCSGRLDHG